MSLFFFFSSRRRHTRYWRDWSSDVCSSDLYRRRKVPVNRKSGNIADFCRRWGHRHRYMVVLDADSIMTGESVASLVRLMEVNARAGIIQTMPKLVGSGTVVCRDHDLSSWPHISVC